MALANLPSEPNVKAYRVDLRCSGKSTTSQLCSAERENWLKPVTAQRVLREEWHACNRRKMPVEVRVGVLNVQSMFWTKRSRSMLCHIVTKVREENADVFLVDLSTRNG